MTEALNTQVDQELEALKAEARALGVAFSNNIGLEALRSRVEQAKADDKEEGKPEPIKPVKKDPKDMTLTEYKNHIRMEQTKLVLVRITCHNPAKSGLHGEYITVANSVIGTVRKFIPFKNFEDGIFIPQCIYDNLKSRVYTESGTQGKGPNMRVVTRDIPEYTLTLLPMPTEADLERMREEQTLAEART